MSAKEKIIFIYPKVWDLDELTKPRFNSRYDFVLLPGEAFAHIQQGNTWAAIKYLELLNTERFIDKTVKRLRALAPAGVISNDENIGCALASIIAERLALPGPNTQSVLLCQHKYYARRAQQECIPEATPQFWLMDKAKQTDGAGPVNFPCFVKPVKGTFSIMAKEVASLEELEEHTTLSMFERLIWHIRLYPFNRLLSRYTDFDKNGNYFLGEQVLTGHQVSVDGYGFNGAINIHGIVDAHWYAGTNSFKRFVYPSRLSAEVQARMREIARTIMTRIKFDNGLFNIEMFYNAEQDSISVIEINPRLCGQFADLFEKVDGTNLYDVLLAIATGNQPVLLKDRGHHRIAASFVLRAFNGERIVRLPTPADIERVKQLFPDLRIHMYCKEGEKLSVQLRQLHDNNSVRIAIINIGGKDRQDLMARFRQVMRELRFKLEPANDFEELYCDQD